MLITTARDIAHALMRPTLAKETADALIQQRSPVQVQLAVAIRAQGPFSIDGVETFFLLNLL